MNISMQNKIFIVTIVLVLLIMIPSALKLKKYTTPASILNKIKANQDSITEIIFNEHKRELTIKYKNNEEIHKVLEKHWSDIINQRLTTEKEVYGNWEITVKKMPRSIGRRKYKIYIATRK
jgi:RNAse (barnase) inhibitor barstar